MARGLGGLAGVDNESQSGAVHELEVREIDEHSARGIAGRLDELLTQCRNRADIELTEELEQGSALVPGPPDLPQGGGVVCVLVRELGYRKRVSISRITVAPLSA